MNKEVCVSCLCVCVCVCVSVCKNVLFRKDIQTVGQIERGVGSLRDNVI